MTRVMGDNVEGGGKGVIMDTSNAMVKEMQTKDVKRKRRQHKL